MTQKPSQTAISTTHKLMNTVYSSASKFHEYLNEEKINHDFAFYHKNYLKIDGEQLLQNYPIPIFSFGDDGDIGFNLDGVFFEFFVNKDSLLKVDFNTFSNSTCRVEVYGAGICTDDFLLERDTEQQFKERILSSREKNFGVAFYPFQRMISRELYNAFLAKKDALIHHEKTL